MSDFTERVVKTVSPSFAFTGTLNSGGRESLGPQLRIPALVGIIW